MATVIVDESFNGASTGTNLVDFTVNNNWVQASGAANGFVVQPSGVMRQNPQRGNGFISDGTNNQGGFIEFTLTNPFQAQQSSYVALRVQDSSNFYGVIIAGNGSQGLRLSSVIGGAVDDTIFRTQAASGETYRIEDDGAELRLYSGSVNGDGGTLLHTEPTTTFATETGKGFVNYSGQASIGPQWDYYKSGVLGGGATYTITLDAGSYSLTGEDVALLSNKSILLDSGNYSYTGQNVDLIVGRSINLGVGNYAYTGQDVALVYNPSGGPTYSLPIDAGAYNYSGQDVQLIANRTLSIDGGIYTYTGSNLSLRANRSISIDSGAYVVTGNAVTLSANRAITLDVGNYAYTGSPVTLSYSGEVIALISGYSVNYAQDAATATYTDDYIKARFI